MPKEDKQKLKKIPKYAIAMQVKWLYKNLIFCYVLYKRSIKIEILLFSMPSSYKQCRY